MKTTKEIQDKLDGIKILNDYQVEKGVYASCDINPLIGFEHKESGVFIHMPFVDECDFNSVNPIEYYGEVFLNSDFFKVENYDIYRNTHIVVLCDRKEEFNGLSYDFLEVNEYNAEVENMVLEAVEKEYAIAEFPSGTWEVFTIEEWERREAK